MQVRKLQTFIVKLAGYQPIPVLASSKPAAYAAAVARLKIPANKRPLSEAIVSAERSKSFNIADADLGGEA